MAEAFLAEYGNNLSISSGKFKGLNVLDLMTSDLQELARGKKPTPERMLAQTYLAMKQVEANIPKPTCAAIVDPAACQLVPYNAKKRGSDSQLV